MSDGDSQLADMRKINHIPDNMPIFYLQGGFELDKLHPVGLLFATVKAAVLQDGFFMLHADPVGDFPKSFMLRNLVVIFASIHERDGIDHEVAVGVIRIQMDGDQHLISVAPHSAGGLLSDRERFFRSDFACRETLYPVVGDDLSTVAEMFLYCSHLFVSALICCLDSTGMP